MNGFARLVPMGVAAAVAIGAVIYFTRPMGLRGPSASQTVAPSIPRTAAPATDLALPSGFAALHSGALAAGSYSTTQFRPMLRFSLGDGWVAPFADDSDEMSFDRMDQGYMNITRVTRVMDPKTHENVIVPQDLVAWLGHNPNFEWAGPSAPVELGGRPAWMLEGNVKSGQGQTDTFAYATGNMWIIGGDRMRYYVVPLEGPDLTIVLGAKTDAGFAALVDAIQIPIDSLEIEPS